MPPRNWRAERYAAVADYAASQHGMRVILCGGPSDLERRYGAAIESHAKTPVVNQIGKDTLPQLLALLGRATALLAPGFRARAHGDHGPHAGDRPLRRDQSRAQRPVPFPHVVRECVRQGRHAVSGAARPTSCRGRKRSRSGA